MKLERLFEEVLKEKVSDRDLERYGKVTWGHLPKGTIVDAHNKEMGNYGKLEVVDESALNLSTNKTCVVLKGKDQFGTDSFYVCENDDFLKLCGGEDKESFKREYMVDLDDKWDYD